MSEKSLKIYNGSEVCARNFTMVSAALIENYHRLVQWAGPGEELGLNSAQFAMLVHLLSFKWDEKMPHPPMATVANRMGITKRYAQKIARELEEEGLLVRHYDPVRDKFARFNLQPLFDRLEEISRHDAAKMASEESKEVA